MTFSTDVCLYAPFEFNTPPTNLTKQELCTTRLNWQVRVKNPFLDIKMKRWRSSIGLWIETIFILTIQTVNMQKVNTLSTAPGGFRPRGRGESVGWWPWPSVYIEHKCKPSNEPRSPRNIFLTPYIFPLLFNKWEKDSVLTLMWLWWWFRSGCVWTIPSPMLAAPDQHITTWHALWIWYSKTASPTLGRIHI